MSGQDRPADAFRVSWDIQESASRRGFDWPDISGVLGKVREELQEIEEARSSGETESAKRELGDVLFATVNLARFLGANPAEELSRANERFRRRFAALEVQLREAGRVMEECTLPELDVFWERVKEHQALVDAAGS